MPVCIVSDIAIFVLKRDVKLQLTKLCLSVYWFSIVSVASVWYNLPGCCIESWSIWGTTCVWWIRIWCEVLGFRWNGLITAVFQNNNSLWEVHFLVALDCVWFETSWEKLLHSYYCGAFSLASFVMPCSLLIILSLFLYILNNSNIFYPTPLYSWFQPRCLMNHFYIIVFDCVQANTSILSKVTQDHQQCHHLWLPDKVDIRETPLIF